MLPSWPEVLNYLEEESVNTGNQPTDLSPHLITCTENGETMWSPQGVPSQSFHHGYNTSQKEQGPGQIPQEFSTIISSLFDLGPSSKPNPFLSKRLERKYRCRGKNFPTISKHEVQRHPPEGLQCSIGVKSVYSEFRLLGFNL